MEQPTSGRRRIDIIDALRGLAVILMVIHHLLYDLVVLLDAPSWLYTNPVLDLAHYVFAGLFIFLSGVSSRFSRSNTKRGLKVFAIALVLSLVTSLPFIGQPIRFGVLHLLGFCMIFYGLTRRVWDGVPRAVAPVLYVLLLLGSALAVAYIPINADFLWMFGWVPPDFYSSDYFPILPWLFVFLLGTWAGQYIVERKLPAWFYETRVKFLPAVGKRALIIYILHQPVLYGIVLALQYMIYK